MTMNEFYPEPKKLLKFERETLQFLKDCYIVKTKFAELSNDANTYYYKIKNGLKNSTFYFESRFDIKFEGRDGYAHISSEIVKENEKKFKKISYNLAVYEQTKNSAKILRKFHFDYDPRETHHRQPHPISHLQYGGKLSKKLEELNLDAAHLDMDINGPRLCYFPISLALLIHFILMEFPGEKNDSLMERNEWRTIVKRDERLILAPFFKNCHLFFNSKNNSKLFINDFYYGN